MCLFVFVFFIEVDSASISYKASFAAPAVKRWTLNISQNYSEGQILLYVYYFIFPPGGGCFITYPGVIHLILLITS